MILNYLIIVAVLACLGLLTWYCIKILRQEEKFIVPENPYTIEYMIQTTANVFSEWQSVSVRDMNLSKEEAIQLEKQRTELREADRKAAYGDREAKEYLILRIRDLMRKKENRKTIFDIDEENINRVIHFDNPSALKARDKFEIMMHIYKKKYEEKALKEFFKEFELTKPIMDADGEIHYEVTDEKIHEIYRIVMSRHTLTYSDKLDILARRIFAGFKGYSAADILFDFAIDEIDCGVSGIPKGSYEIKNLETSFKDEEKRKKIKFSYQSIWIMLSGLKIHLSFLEFDNQDDLVRVCQNIYKYHATEMLSRQKSYVIGTMIDGSRIVVVRPDMASSWGFFKRSFDSTPGLELSTLLTDENAIIPITMLKWIVRGYQNCVISGGMGVGKTTNLKSLIRYLPGDLAIRVYETSAELNAQYAYPWRNIMGLQETENIKQQEEMDVGMKLNSDVTILGEMATQESCGFYVQSDRKGSKLAIGTIHTMSPRKLIDYVRDSLPGYSNKDAAEKAAIEAIRFDIHLDRIKDHRYLDYITEIVPFNDKRYPSEMPENADKPIELLQTMDSMEYYKRQTDREHCTFNEVVKFEDGKYVLKNMPTEETMLKIRNNLTYEEEQLFLKDMAMIQRISKEGA